MSEREADGIARAVMLMKQTADELPGQFPASGSLTYHAGVKEGAPAWLCEFEGDLTSTESTVTGWATTPDEAVRIAVEAAWRSVPQR